MKPSDTNTEFKPLQTTGIRFAPIIDLPEDYEVYDFSGGYDPNRTLASAYGIGRYNEVRPGMYEGEQFEGIRNIHVGIDIAAPTHEPVHAFYGGSIFKLGDNNLAYDYGPTIITRHEWLGQIVYALHGHLSRSSLLSWKEGDCFNGGDVLAHVGTEQENGGWNPHLHFQLSLIKPDTHDLPGAVAATDLDWALGAFPDPRLVLGPLY
ncbi:MAG: peptidase M23 [Deltaproteobacteria bacterium]|nr:peptidase M23 [Deltaproteobacteria bacterium]